MYHELKDFETSCQHYCGADIKIKCSHRIQEIIDRCSFRETEILKYITTCGSSHLPYMAGPLVGFEKTHIQFHLNILTFGSHIVGLGQEFFYVICYDEIHIPTVVIFSQIIESETFDIIRKLEKLKVFL